MGESTQLAPPANGVLRLEELAGAIDYFSLPVEKATQLIRAVNIFNKSFSKERWPQIPDSPSYILGMPQGTHVAYQSANGVGDVVALEEFRAKITGNLGLKAELERMIAMYSPQPKNGGC